MEKFRTSDSCYESSSLSKRRNLRINNKAYNSMVEYTSDICRVDSSNLFKPINHSDLSGGMVDALNLEFSFLITRR